MIKEQLIDISERAISLYGENTESLENYEYRMLYKERFSENDIFMIHLEKRDSDYRLGWLFPLGSIFSKEHNYKDNLHYAIYARIASEYIASNSIRIGVKIETDKALDNIHILIAKKDRLLANNNCFIDELLPALSKYGYFEQFSSMKGIYTNEWSGYYINQVKESILVLYRSYILNDKYFKMIFEENLPFQQNPYYRFMLLYQIIENKMEKIFYSKIEEMKIINSTIGSIREKITELSSERKLITILFKEIYKKNEIDDYIKDDLRQLLKLFKPDEYFAENFTFPNAIYDIRNILVHSYYKCLAMSIDLKAIVDYFEIQIIENIKYEESA